jgi:hypothetical protein
MKLAAASLCECVMSMSILQQSGHLLSAAAHGLYRGRGRGGDCCAALHISSVLPQLLKEVWLLRPMWEGFGRDGARTLLHESIRRPISAASLPSLRHRTQTRSLGLTAIRLASGGFEAAKKVTRGATVSVTRLAPNHISQLSTPMAVSLVHL